MQVHLDFNLNRFVYICIFSFLPESARWLMSQGRKEAALKELQRAARVNKRSVSGDLLDKVLKHSLSSET